MRSRPVLRAAREGGAFYRAQLAEELRERGYEIGPAGENGRYFRITGISPDAEQAFSKRTVEVQQAARAFRAEHGRAPERGELRALAIQPAARRSRTPAPSSTRAGRRPLPPTASTRRTSPSCATPTGRHRCRPVAGRRRSSVRLPPAAPSSTRASCAPSRCSKLPATAETTISNNLAAMAADPSREIDADARAAGIAAVERRIGGQLSAEQRAAIDTVIGPGRAAVLVGPAGTVHLSETRDEAIEHAARSYDRLAAEHGHAHVALMSDASNVEIDHLNLRIQALRRGRHELSPTGVEHPAGHHVHAGDRVIWTRPMPVRDGARVENGQRGEIVGLDGAQLAVRLDGSVALDAGQLDAVRLGYATHVVREQGATVRRSVVITGGWQTSRETAYVERTRATDGVEWHSGRDDLDGHDDADRLDQSRSG